MFHRIANLFKGFLGLFISGLEKRNPEALLEVEKENLRKLDEAVQSGRLQLVLNASPTQIRPDVVTLDVEGRSVELPNDFVFIFAGGVLPTKFLQSAGISMKTVRGESLSVG